MAVVDVNLRRSSLAERILFGILALALLVLGIFFIAAALVAGSILAAVALLRLWWIKRRVSKAQEERYLSTEYTVVEREELPPPSLPPGR